MVTNKYAKYRQQPAPEQEEAPVNKYAKYRQPAPVSNGAGMGSVNPMVAEGLRVQQEANLAPRSGIQLPPQVGPVMSPAKRVQVRDENAFGQDPINPEKIADLLLTPEQKQQRREHNLLNMSPMPMAFDPQGNEQVGTPVDRDIATGVVTSPLRVVQGGMKGVEAAVNFLPDVADALNSVGAKERAALGDAPNAPAMRLSLPEIQTPEGMESTTGDMIQGLAQYLVVRGGLGKGMKGGGAPGGLAKDSLATGLAFEGDTPRMLDGIDLNAIPEGPMRDYAAWLRTQPGDSPIFGRLKNAIEDLTINSAAYVAPQLAVRGTQAVADAVRPKPPVPAGPPVGARAMAPAGPSQPAPVAPAAPPVAVQPPPPRPAPAPYSMDPEPAQRGNFVTRNLDRIAGGALGATLGGTGDAYAAPGDGGGGNNFGAATGAAIGMFGPRAARSAAGRLGRGIQRPRAPAAAAAFDERAAAKAVREALRTVNITTMDEARAAATGRYGDKPASVADLSQNATGLAAGVSRMPGSTGDAARARFEDLTETRPGRLERDIADTTGLSPATIQGDVDRMAALARQQATPAYNNLRQTYTTILNPQLDALRDLDIMRSHIRAADQYRQTMATTERRQVGDFEYWDLVKRSIDADEQALVARGRPVPFDLDSARQSLVRTMDNMVPEYAAARQLGGEAPRMQEAFEQGRRLMGGRYRAEEVAAMVQDITGQQLTAMQSGVIRSMLDKTDGARSAMAALMSSRSRTALREVFGADVAEELQRRFRADKAIVENAGRINPNVGSVTSQAQLSEGGVGPMLENLIRTARNPFEAALAYLGSTGGYSKAQRDLMGQMLLGGMTDENLARIFRDPPRGRGRSRRNPPAAPPPAPGGGAPQAAPPAGPTVAPPAQMGMGGPPGTTSMASPTVTGIVAGGGIGAMANPDDPAKGAVVGAALGGVTGAGVGKLVKGGREPPVAKGPPAIEAPKPPTQRGFGGNSSLPMDEASRMERAREWGKGYQVFEATHATSADFDAFDPTKIGRSDPGWRGEGHYFTALTPQKKTQFAEGQGHAYGQVNRDGTIKEGAHNLPVLVRMKKPFTDSDAESPAIAAAFAKAGYRGIGKNWETGKPLSVLKPGLRSDYDLGGKSLGYDASRALLPEDAKAFTTAAKKLGYDGANWEGELVVFPGFENNIRGKFAAFDPSQEGSSKLLAGLGGQAPELALGAGSAAVASTRDPDKNGDGVVSREERMMHDAEVGGSFLATTFLAGAARNALKGGKATRQSNAIEDLRIGKDKVPPGMSPEEEASFRRVWADADDDLPPPNQRGFGGGKGPEVLPPDLSAGPPKKGKKGQAYRMGPEGIPEPPIPPKAKVKAITPPPKVSKTEQVAIDNLKRATRDYNRLNQKHVMKDEREIFVKPAYDRMVKAEQRLTKVRETDDTWRTTKARIGEVMNEPKNALKVAAGMTAVGAPIVIGANLLANGGDGGKAKGPPPMSPTDPKFYWEQVIAPDRETMIDVQVALADWREWPDGVEQTGANGKYTKAAIRSWRARRGKDPDAPMTRSDLKELLAGRNGYSGDGGEWGKKGEWYRADGSLVKIPQ